MVLRLGSYASVLSLIVATVFVEAPAAASDSALVAVRKVLWADLVSAEMVNACSPLGGPLAERMRAGYAAWRSTYRLEEFWRQRAPWEAPPSRATVTADARAAAAKALQERGPAPACRAFVEALRGSGMNLRALHPEAFTQNGEPIQLDIESRPAPIAAPAPAEFRPTASPLLTDSAPRLARPAAATASSAPVRPARPASPPSPAAVATGRAATLLTRPSPPKRRPAPPSTASAPVKRADPVWYPPPPLYNPRSVTGY